MTILHFLPLLLSVVIVTNGAPVGGNCMTPLGTIIECRRDVIGTKIQEDYTQDQQIPSIIDNENSELQSKGFIDFLKKRIEQLGCFVDRIVGEGVTEDETGTREPHGKYRQFGGVTEEKKEERKTETENPLDKSESPFFKHLGGLALAYLDLFKVGFNMLTGGALNL